MKYADCRLGMRVLVRSDGKAGRIVRLHPILQATGAIPAGAPGVMFNMISVRWDDPSERAPSGAPIVGVVLDPRDVDPAQ